MSTHCTVIIGAMERLTAIRERVPDGEILSFDDKEPLKALEAITSRQPDVIALERLFAATSRGAALINRIKADSALDRIEIRVVSIDGTYRVSPRRPTTPGHSASPTQSAPASVDGHIDAAGPAPAAVTPPASPHLDFTGTRRAPRFQMADGTEAQIDGAVATVVDLSTYGAQILCSTPLKPQQQVLMVLADDFGIVYLSASVAWAFFEIPKGVSRYRAGIEFKNAEGKAVDAFRSRHTMPPA